MVKEPSLSALILCKFGEDLDAWNAVYFSDFISFATGVSIFLSYPKAQYCREAAWTAWALSIVKKYLRPSTECIGFGFFRKERVKPIWDFIFLPNSRFLVANICTITITYTVTSYHWQEDTEFREKAFILNTLFQLFLKYQLRLHSNA